MFFGTATFISYIIFMIKFDSLTIKQAKNFLIFVPIIFIFALVEIVLEVKYGIKKLFKLVSFLSIKTYKKIKYKRIMKKVKKDKELKPKEITWIKKYKGEQNDS